MCTTYSVNSDPRRTGVPITMKLTIKDGIVYEAVLTSIYRDEPYATPVGFKKRGNFVEIKAYKNSKLFNVLLSCNTIVLNIVHEPQLFVKTAFKRERVVEFDAKREVMIVGGLPVLAESVGYIVLEKTFAVNHGEYVVAVYEVKDIGFNDLAEIEPYTRCYGNLVEFAVYATKVRDIKDLEERLQYAKKADNVLEIINKTCNEEYVDVAKKLRVLIDTWLGK